MLTEAWKVDLNFLPARDIPILPHNLIEDELQNASAVAEKEFQDSWQSILEGSYAISNLM
jgi:hypothetical protein